MTDAEYRQRIAAVEGEANNRLDAIEAAINRCRVFIDPETDPRLHDRHRSAIRSAHYHARKLVEDWMKAATEAIEAEYYAPSEDVPRT